VHLRYCYGGVFELKVSIKVGQPADEERHVFRRLGIEPALALLMVSGGGCEKGARSGQRRRHGRKCGEKADIRTERVPHARSRVRGRHFNPARSLLYPQLSRALSFLLSLPFQRDIARVAASELGRHVLSG
jgi:hypothetical protein